MNMQESAQKEKKRRSPTKGERLKTTYLNLKNHYFVTIRVLLTIPFAVRSETW